jgi:hypothetical protein
LQEGEAPVHVASESIVYRDRLTPPQQELCRTLLVLTRCGLPLPTYFLADEKHSRCLTDKVYLLTTLLLDSGVLCSKHCPRSTTPF